VFSKNVELRGLVGLSDPSSQTALPTTTPSIEADAGDALLSMGFTPQEVELALEGHDEAGATTIEKTIAYALRRLGSGS